MRYWKCISTMCDRLTIGKIYETDDDGHGLRYDTGVIDTARCGIMDFRFSKFEEVKGEDEMEDLREMLKPCYVVKRRDNSICAIFEIESGLKLQERLNMGNCHLSDYNKNLCKKDDQISDTDIMEIYGFSKYETFDISTYNRKLIWKREEKSPTQIKLEELEKKQREIADEMEKLRKEL